MPLMVMGEALGFTPNDYDNIRCWIIWCFAWAANGSFGSDVFNTFWSLYSSIRNWI